MGDWPEPWWKKPEKKYAQADDSGQTLPYGMGYPWFCGSILVKAMPWPMKNRCGFIAKPVRMGENSQHGAG